MLKKEEKFCARLRVKNCEYWCTHQSGFEPRRTGKSPFTHTKDTDCPAYFVVSREVSLRSLVVRSMTEEHNHPLSQELWEKYSRVRKLDKTQEDAVRDLQEEGLKDAAVARIMTEKTNKLVCRKDAENIRTRAEVTKKSSRNEIALLEAKLQNFKSIDPEVEFWTLAVEGKLNSHCIAASDTKRAFAETPEVLFIDATYKINREG